MSRDKQIEEMARTMCNCYDSSYCKMHGNSCDLKCISGFNALGLYNAGYRKASEVAREIDDLKRYIRLNEDIALKCKEENGEQNREYWKGKLSAFKQIRGYIDSELKKKYTEDGE